LRRTVEERRGGKIREERITAMRIRKGIRNRRIIPVERILILPSRKTRLKNLDLVIGIITTKTAGEEGAMITEGLEEASKAVIMTGISREGTNRTEVMTTATPTTGKIGSLMKEGSIKGRTGCRNLPVR